ncbi:MAG TPA: hypothetical protein VL049_18010 [Candidatus Dormibacteraeota bacterium]|nr:hypothetical protein [Candidatus Dormibacteraeota bacterium]
MYQDVILRQTRIAASLAVAALAFGASVAGAQDIPKCQGTIVKGAQQYASARIKALQKCEEGRLTGKITTTCAADSKTQDKITKAAQKLQDGIAKSCASVTVGDLGFGNLVNRCTGGLYAGEYCATDAQCPGTCVGGTKNGEWCTSNGNCPSGTCTGNGGPGTCSGTSLCPAFLNDKLGTPCVAPLASAADVGTCLTCTSAQKIDAVIDTFYGTLLPASADKDVLKCQKDIGKRTAKYFDAVEKALSKCQQAVIKAGSGTCPDAKATDSITKAAGKLDAALAKTCVDASKISGGARPSQILGEAPRFGTCAPVDTQTPAGLSAALGCLAGNAASCDVGLSVATPACSTLLCGNGQIDAGETCDDGNTVADSGVGADDICPPDCSVSPCTSPTGTQSVTVQLATSVPLVNALVLVGYDDNKVSIPGVGANPSVLASVTSGVFATSPRDTETALRIDLEDPTLAGVGSGAAATVTFGTCTGTPVTAADFNCIVVSAGDTSFAEVFGATCAVTVP